MADALSILNGFLESLQLNFANPMSLVINLILSVIVGGIVVLVIIEIFSKKFSEDVSPMNAFLVVLVSSLINLVGLVPLLGTFIAQVPLLGILVVVLPILVWIILVKLFFQSFGILHVVLIGSICYFVTMYLVPTLVIMVAGYIPVI